MVRENPVGDDDEHTCMFRPAGSMSVSDTPPQGV
jgi:hypothetical protein